MHDYGKKLDADYPRRQQYTDREDKHLVEFLATYNPTGTDRRGNKLWKDTLCGNVSMRCSHHLCQTADVDHSWTSSLGLRRTLGNRGETITRRATFGLTERSRSSSSRREEKRQSCRRMTIRRQTRSHGPRRPRSGAESQGETVMTRLRTPRRYQRGNLRRSGRWMSQAWL